VSLYREFGYKKGTPSTYTYAEVIATRRLRMDKHRKVFWGVVLLIIALIGGFLLLAPAAVNWGIQ